MATYFDPDRQSNVDYTNVKKVLDDVLDGFCSPEQASDVYGVVLDLDAETVDLGATTQRREQMDTVA